MNHVVPEIIPAILAHSQAEAFQYDQAANEAEWIQVDCLDGHFLPNTSFYDPTSWPTQGPNIELHLMCENPQRVIEAWRAHPRCKRAVWHAELSIDHEQLLEWCASHELEAGIALNPETSLERVHSLVPRLDMLLFLGVHPGWSGQPFIPTVKEKIREAHALYPSLPLGVDGGVEADLIPELAELGITRFYTASRVFHQQHLSPREALHTLQHIAQTACI